MKIKSIRSGKKPPTGGRAHSTAFSDAETGALVLSDIKRGLRYSYDPLFDWRPWPNQKHATIEVDQHGLRSSGWGKRKAYRILLLGGSFAWGYGASSNLSTPGGVIESELRKRGIDAEVICLADQNYNSTHEMRSFSFSVYDLKPDAVICITGHNDISTAYLGFHDFNRRSNQIMLFVNWGIRTGLINIGSRLKAAAKAALGFDSRFAVPKEESRNTFARASRSEVALRLCRQKIDLIANYGLATRLKTIFVLQPTLYTRANPTAGEQKYIRAEVADRFDFYRDYLTRLSDDIWNDKKMTKQFGKNVRFVDCTTCFDGQDEELYIDAAHTSDRGYALFSDALVDAIAPFLSEPVS